MTLFQTNKEIGSMKKSSIKRHTLKAAKTLLSYFQKRPLKWTVAPKKKKSGKGRKNPRQTAVDEWTFLYMEESQKTMSTEIQMTHF